MPAQMQVGGQTLVLNGMGMREATMLNVDVYVAGLYLATPSSNAASLLRDMGTMRIVLKLVRDVERKEMTEALRGGLERNAGGRMSALAARADRLERLIPDLRKGDTIAFTYLADDEAVLFVDVNGEERGRVEGTDFAQAFFAIWLGKPPNTDLKNGLLGGECKSAAGSLLFEEHSVRWMPIGCRAGRAQERCRDRCAPPKVDRVN